MHANPARALPKHGDPGRVPVEHVDVLVHPLQRCHLVTQAHIAAQQVVAKAEETKGPEPVVDGDQDHVLLQQRGMVVLVGRAQRETTAVDPEHDGLLLRSVQGSIWQEDVEEETILATASLSSVLTKCLNLDKSKCLKRLSVGRAKNIYVFV